MLSSILLFLIIVAIIYLRFRQKKKALMTQARDLLAGRISRDSIGLIAGVIEGLRELTNDQEAQDLLHQVEKRFGNME
jgi:hypothetical protein